MTVVYRRLLTDRSFVIGVGAVALSAVALGMIPLSLILSPGESVATGAVAAGAFGLANAVGVPVQGAVMARVPARWIVSIGAGVSCSFMLLVAAMPGSGAQSVLLAGAGVSFPALAAALRASIPRSFSEPAERSGAYALLSVAFQAGLATGPVVAGMLVTSAPRPLSVVVVALVIAAAGGLAAVSMGMTAPTRTARSSLPLAGAAPFARIVSIGGLVAVATGSLTVIVPASVDAAGRDGLAGQVLACLALGEAVGALLFGARPVPSSRRAQLLTALALTAGGFATLVIAADHIVLLAALVLVVGGLSSPVAIVLSGALDVVVPPRFVASAYGVVVVAAVGGSAVGTSVAGLIVGSGGGVAGAAAMAALAISIAGVLSLRHVEGRTPSR